MRTEQQYQIAVCQALGWVHEKAGSLVVHPILGMELVCGECRAVILNDGSYNWAKHESCGPMGCECYGGRWKLFKSCWVKGNNKVMPLPPLTLDLMASARATLTPGQKLAYMHELSRVVLFTDRDVDKPIDFTPAGCEYHEGYEEFALIDATKEQHAEAFMRVWGLP